jgi:thiol-disulfide isomerase/thioredoxin
MPSFTLELDNRQELTEALSGDKWIVACLCASWCDVCRQYRSAFEEFAEQHPDKTFIWIDIEDQADIVGDFDVENFPTLQIQRGDTVAFFGTVLPEWRQANRLLLALSEQTEDQLKKEAFSSEERREWQNEYNLRRKLHETLNN